MKISIDSDAYYPFYFLIDSDNKIFDKIEATQEEKIWMDKVFEDFKKVQDFIKDKLGEND